LSAQALLPLPQLELPDLGELDVRPRLANAKCYARYAPEMTSAPGRNHPVLAEMLIRRFAPPVEDDVLVVVDPMCGPGTFLCEAADYGHAVAGVDISPRCVELARRNLTLRAGLAPSVAERQVQVGDASRMEFAPLGADLIITSPVYPKQNKNSGDSELQTHLKTKRGLKAQLEFWDSDTPGHLARVPGSEFWPRMGAVWRGCLRLARVGGRLLVVTKDRVQHGQRAPFTRMVAESVAAAGWQVEGLLWRRLDPSNTQRMQMWHFAQKGRVYPLVDREDVIVARRAS